ncbi:hypothetical protein IW261DRAFT_1092194 [Armillaria novae-zelandiae]|uniref:Homeobox KN domain-containing protein n=1 Tax=Armillaria novae-zelandiae TaxID=153914 RepID=A0AA39PCI3_9AGAR|nr:hypothetical protein IW261DRAFT_1092194 [Armillaria novae-zelandiae]
MPVSSEKNLDDRLSCVVDSLLTAHNTSDLSLEKFYHEWSHLQQDILDADNLPPSTTELAYSVSKTVEIICQSMMNLHVRANDILQEVGRAEPAPPPPTRVIKKKRTHSSTSPEPPTSRKRSKRTATAESAPSSSFLSSRSCSPAPKRDYTPLYTWLSDNLHNPYPSASVRSDLGRKSGGADVERWFTTARRRIGWTELVKRVAGGRERVVSAAKYYWKGEGEGEEYPGIDVEFALIDKNLEDVYGPRLGGPGEVVKLFGVVPR